MTAIIHTEQIYLVGGAVRDSLLGLSVHERDYVVIGADAAQLLALGFLPMNSEFPVFQNPHTGDEYALARREAKIATGYKGFTVESGIDVTLEEDLARRDLTINAIAQDQDGRIIDPFNGQADLQARRLRHITSAFVHDPVRLLRIARFAAQFWHLGFRITHSTFKLLKDMVQPNEMKSLIPYHFQKSMLRALATESPCRFFITLQRIHALQYLLPELAAAMSETPPPHSNDPQSDSMVALQRATELTQNIEVRFAAVMGTVMPNFNVVAKMGKKFNLNQNLIDVLTQVLTWPAYRVATATPQILLKLLEANRFLHFPQKLVPLTQVWQALEPSIGKIAAIRVTSALQAALTVRAEKLQTEGLTGANLGEALRQQRILVIETAINR